MTEYPMPRRDTKNILQRWPDIRGRTGGGGGGGAPPGAAIGGDAAVASAAVALLAGISWAHGPRFQGIANAAEGSNVRGEERFHSNNVSCEPGKDRATTSVF